MFFIRVRHPTNLTRLGVIGALLWLAILVSLAMVDIVTRTWLVLPGP